MGGQVNRMTESFGNLRWYQYIGPWKFRPWIMAFGFTIVFISLTTGQSYAVGDVLSGPWLIGVFMAIVAGGLMGVVMSLGRRWQTRFGVKWGSYIFFPFIAVIIVMLFRGFLNQYPIALLGSAPNVIAGFTRNMLMAFVFLAIAGSLTFRLEREVRKTADALAISREQQELILEGDEESRRQIADLLHDKVQAGLIAACLELRDASTSLSSSEKHRIEGVIERLEGLRARDVRGAARTLSPSLQDVDLQTALEELAAQYEPSIEVNIDVDTQVEKSVTDSHRLLGLYRMTEQALMNAAHHGQARSIQVKICERGPNRIELQVADDGRGMTQGELTAGVGFALFTTWTRSLDGSWQLQARPGGGSVFSATVPNL